MDQMRIKKNNYYTKQEIASRYIQMEEFHPGFLERKQTLEYVIWMLMAFEVIVIAYTYMFVYRSVPDFLPLCFMLAMRLFWLRVLIRTDYRLLGVFLLSANVVTFIRNFSVLGAVSFYSIFYMIYTVLYILDFLLGAGFLIYIMINKKARAVVRDTAYVIRGKEIGIHNKMELIRRDLEYFQQKEPDQETMVPAEYGAASEDGAASDDGVHI